MNIRNLVAGLVLCVITAAYASLIGTIPDRTLPNTPGPSFMPWLIAAMTGALSLALLAQGVIGLRQSGASEESAPFAEIDGRAVLLLLAFAVYLAALPYVGFLYGSIVFFAALMVLFGARSPLLIIAAAVVVPLALQFVFRHAFTIILPTGSL